jgi:hypothetical protein
VRLSVKTNVDEVIAALDRELSKVNDIAIPRALNDLRDQAQVAGLRKISEIYKIGPRTTEKYVTLKLATTTNLEATITVKGNGSHKRHRQVAISGVDFRYACAKYPQSGYRR